MFSWIIFPVIKLSIPVGHPTMIDIEHPDNRHVNHSLVMKYADIIDKSRKITEMIAVGNYLNPPLYENLKFSILQR
jgi:hypothetical protein